MAVPRTVTITRRRYITDNTPTAFEFTDVENADLSTNYESDTITVSGLIGSAAISVVNGFYRLNGGEPTSAAGTVVNGDQVSALGTSPDTNSDQTDVTVTIGGYSDTFSIATADLDIQPDPFSFTDVTGATALTTYTSDTITLTGLNSSAPVTINTTGLSGAVGYSKNGGAFTTVPGTAVNGDQFRVRLTTGASGSATFSTTLTIGGISDTYSVTNSTYSPSLNFSNARNGQYVAAIAA